MILGLRAILISAAILSLCSTVYGAGIHGHVTKVDQKGKCLSLEWSNDTERVVCWKDATKFSVLETGKAAKPSDVRKGTYVRMEGEETGPWKEMPWGKEGKFSPASIVIWEEPSRPLKP